MVKYILRNISKYDINLGDLRYKIPAGQARDLLSKTAHLLWSDIKSSKINGSISKRLGKTLIEIQNDIEPKPPDIYSIIRNAKSVKFPNRVKSSVIIEVGDISEEIQNISINEGDDFLKELDEEGNFETASPLLFSEKDGKKKED